MTNEEKQLLLKDISARLQYGVKLKPVGLEDTIISYAILKGISKDDNGDYHFEINDRDIDGNKLSYGSFKLGRSVISYLPYLRPMSSMTEKEKKEFDNFCVIDVFVWKGNYEIGYKNQAIIMSNAIDWLNKKMFDYRGLIPMGLALPAPEGMYKGNTK